MSIEHYVCHCAVLLIGLWSASIAQRDARTDAMLRAAVAVGEIAVCRSWAASIAHCILGSLLCVWHSGYVARAQWLCCKGQGVSAHGLQAQA